MIVKMASNSEGHVWTASDVEEISFLPKGKGDIHCTETRNFSQPQTVFGDKKSECVHVVVAAQEDYP
jgi:hypothetical protein